MASTTTGGIRKFLIGGSPDSEIMSPANRNRIGAEAKPERAMMIARGFDWATRRP